MLASGHGRDVHRNGDLPGHLRGLGDEMVGGHGDEFGVADPLVGPTEHLVTDVPTLDPVTDGDDRAKLHEVVR